MTKHKSFILNSRRVYVAQTMVDMTTHDRRTTLFAIRLYHVIYTVPRTGTRWRGSSTCRKQAVCVKD